MTGDKYLGKHLKKLRERCGYSQEKLAEIVGLEYQTISRIETGLYFTSFENLKKISKALGVSLCELFDFYENELSEKELKKLIMQDIKLFKKEDLINIRKMINLYKDAICIKNIKK